VLLATPSRRIVAEAVGTALVVAAVVGSGIMAQRLATDPAVALLANTIATGGALVAILLIFGPVSGAHLNPAVTVVMAATRGLTPRLAAAYVVAQIAGAIAGAMLANAMFDLSAVSWSEQVRSGHAQLLSEGVATFGLLGVVITVGRTRPAIAPLAVAAYIVAAYWFTSSTSFANPAVTIGRAFSDTYAGIRPADIGGFVVAQAIGATVGGAMFAWLVPLSPANARAVISPASR
jgi:glycerol uptake facilitator-like aquaporin